MGSTPSNEGGGGTLHGAPTSGEVEKGFGVAAFFNDDGAPVGGARPRGSLKDQNEVWEVRVARLKEGMVQVDLTGGVDSWQWWL
jgi:hypothetical protein